MQAIITKFIGPTDTRGARIKATASSGSVTVGYPYELSGQECHRFAADALCEKLGGRPAGWDSSRLIGGGLPDGTYCFVFSNS